MRATIVEPGRNGSAAVKEAQDPDAQDGDLLVRGLLVGVCGTDREIAQGAYGTPPSGHKKLIIGTEASGGALSRSSLSASPRGSASSEFC